jgi:hypothetical protein
VARDDLATVTLRSHRQILDNVWRPTLGPLPFLGVRHSMIVKIADSRRWNKKTYNNAIGALRRAFAFGFLDYPDRHDPASGLRSARIGKKDRPKIDPFTIQDAEMLIAALHEEWGEAHGNYDEFGFFTGLRPSEEIAPGVAKDAGFRSGLRISLSRLKITRVIPRPVSFSSTPADLGRPKFSWPTEGSPSQAKSANSPEITF